MANFCLHKDTVLRFLKALKEGDLDPETLVKMSSEERRAAFEPYVGKDHAEAVNAEFEKKVLTKNIQQTLITWVKDVAGLKPEVRNDLVNRVNRIDERILNPENEQAFLKDLASKKLGADVTLDEVKQVNELVNNLRDTKAQITDEEGNLKKPERAIGEDATPEELAYGNAARDLESYVESLKLNAGDSSTLKKILQTAYNTPMRLLTFGHGGVIPFTHTRSAAFTPGEFKIFARTVGRAYSYLGTESQVFGKTIAPELTQGTARHTRDMAEIRSDPMYDFMVKSGLKINTQSHPLGLGMSKWTNRSFDALKGMRRDLFKKYWNKMPETDKTPDTAKRLAKEVNHATGEVNTPPAINKVAGGLMFAPKLKASKYLAAFADPFTSGRSAKRAAAMIGVQIGLLAVNDLVNRYIFGKTGSDTVNWSDPTHADWLRMKVDGMTVPISPIFETMKLPFRFGADLLNPASYDKTKVLKTEVASALHPTLSQSYNLATGKEMWSGRPLPFRGASQLLFGDHRKGEPLNKAEYASGFGPIPVQPIAKEIAKNGWHLDSAMAPSLIEAFLSGAMGEHIYEQKPSKKKNTFGTFQKFQGFGTLK